MWPATTAAAPVRPATAAVSHAGHTRLASPAASPTPTATAITVRVVPVSLRAPVAGFTAPSADWTRVRAAPVTVVTAPPTPAFTRAQNEGDSAGVGRVRAAGV